MRQLRHEVYHLTDAEVVEILAHLEPEELEHLIANTRAHDEDSFQRLCELMRRMQN